MEAEGDSRFVLLGDELYTDDEGTHIKALPDNARVDLDLLGLVFWTWVDDDNALPTGRLLEGTEIPELDYISAAEPPFGTVLPMTSGSDDKGDYVAFVAAYSELLGLIEELQADDTPYLTHEAYVARGGNICPVCESDQVEADSPDVDGVHCVYEARCNSCGASWRDVYTLTGYTEVVEGDAED